MTEPVDHAIDVLNRIHQADPAVLPALIGYRVACNETLADDPTVQVGADWPHPTAVGLLGIINGIFGEAGQLGPISAHYDYAGHLTRFERTA